MDVIDRAPLHGGRVIAFAQRRRDALYDGARDVSNIALRGTMHMTAEDANNPPGLLQCSPQSPQRLRCREVQPIRAHQNLKRRMVRENRNRLARVTLDQISEAPCALGTKIAAVSWAERVQSNEPDRIIVDRIVEKVGAAEISVGREGGVQIGSSIPVAGEQINRRARFPEYCCCLGIFVFASVVHDEYSEA